jgi:hypothetical protein
MKPGSDPRLLRLTMDGYLTAHWGATPCIKIVRTMWVRLIDLRGRRRNSEAVCKMILRAEERRCRYGPTSTDHLNLRGKSHSAAKPAVVTILPRRVGHTDGEKVR